MELLILVSVSVDYQYRECRDQLSRFYTVFRLQWRGYGQTDINTVDCGDGGGGTQLGGGGGSGR